MSTDTIYAPASGQGASAVAVIRISGPQSREALSSLCVSVPDARQLAVRSLTHDGAMLDHAMVVWFEAGRSFTGEEGAEIQCHGGPAVVRDILDALSRCTGLRLAEPGEFTRRAFENGRLDLTQADGLADLVTAETAYQKQQALRVMAGSVSRETETWRDALIGARALLEVTIDWADEEVPTNVLPEVTSVLESTAASMGDALNRYRRTERLRTGVEIALIGAPNAGKSTLLNAIAGRDVALATPIAGTTRDVLEVRCDLHGVPTTILDTAGLREGTDEIEASGIARARLRAAAADMRVLLVSDDAPTPPEAEALMGEGDLVVWSKADRSTGPADLVLSAQTGEGLDTLIARLSSCVADMAGSAGVIGHARQEQAVRKAFDEVHLCLEALDRVETEILSEHLRRACAALDGMTGRHSVEDVLGAVFGRFCLGK